MSSALKSHDHPLLGKQLYLPVYAVHVITHPEAIRCTSVVITSFHLLKFEMKTNGSQMSKLQCYVHSDRIGLPLRKNRIEHVTYFPG